MLPEIIGLKHKIKNKFEIEKYVSIKNNTLDKFKRKHFENTKKRQSFC